MQKSIEWENLKLTVNQRAFFLFSCAVKWKTKFYHSHENLFEASENRIDVIYLKYGNGTATSIKYHVTRGYRHKINQTWQNSHFYYFDGGLYECWFVMSLTFPLCLCVLSGTCRKYDRGTSAYLCMQCFNIGKSFSCITFYERPEGKTDTD